MRTIIRGEEWMVRKVERNSLQNEVLHCAGVSPLVRDREAIFLTDLDIPEIVDPANIRLVADDSPHFRKTQLYLESQWRQQIPTDSALHIGNKAAMDPMEYQLEPAQIALKRPRQRILIADAVGLGKTLEAGILMSELIARGKGKRILVVTVKSMMAQFQKEMWNRFTIPLIRLDSQKIHKIRAKLPANHNPFSYYDKTIVSIDTLKRDIEYRTHLENAYWDIIVIDEAQNVAERGEHQAQRARLAKLLADRSDTMIMLSATPHDGRPRSFASLMNMLDATAIANPEDYTADDIQGLFVRRFKEDIKEQTQGAFKERRVVRESCAASQREEEAYQIFAGMSLEMDLGKGNRPGQLFKTALEKTMFSSPAACIKSIDNRLAKLSKKYEDDDIPDIRALEELREALEKITPEDFSRYQRLLDMLRSREYGWSGKTNDRIVIFTERIETMRYLADHLREDLDLEEDAVQTMHGGMSDVEQQRIVESFGRKESPVRILVASDVASEGLNLHYLSHRLIHFDVPWSLMVFQQRNGRIDRYGQEQQPDIRYMLIGSENPRIQGDMRVIEVLVDKEEQATKNIGDPTLLSARSSVEEEEQAVGEAIEKGVGAAAFEKQLDENMAKLSPFEMMMKLASESKAKDGVQIKDDETLFSDLDYVREGLSILNQSKAQPFQKLDTVRGLDVVMTQEIRQRLNSVLPDEAIPAGDYLRLSTDKTFCMNEMRRSMQGGLADTAWPKAQYLWKQHPLCAWLNDKASLLYGRGEAPMILSPGLKESETVFIVSGTLPNAMAQPLVDEWFGILYDQDQYAGQLTMDEVLRRTRLRRMDLVNTQSLTDENLADAEALLPDVIKRAEAWLDDCSKEYTARIQPLLDEEVEKLGDLEKKHKEYGQRKSGSQRKKDVAEREVTELFDGLVQWVDDSLSVKGNAHIRVMAALKGTMA